MHFCGGGRGRIECGELFPIRSQRTISTVLTPARCSGPPGRNGRAVARHLQGFYWARWDVHGDSLVDLVTLGGIARTGAEGDGQIKEADTRAEGILPWLSSIAFALFAARDR